MYSGEVVEALINRVGWPEPQEDSFVIEINESNLTSEYGKKFNSFHQLVTVENVYAAIAETTTNEEEFNEILSDIRKQAVLSIAPLILDTNEQYQTDIDYSSVIEANIAVFDDAIGFKTAMMVLELFVSSKRSNLAERNAKLAISNLKLEIEGFRSESTGRMMAIGITQKLERAIRKASNKIFPVVPIVTSKSIW